MFSDLLKEKNQIDMKLLGYIQSNVVDADIVHHRGGVFSSSIARPQPVLAEAAPAAKVEEEEEEEDDDMGFGLFD